MNKKDNLMTITLMPDMDDFAIIAFQTMNQKCYQFASYMNNVFELNLSNIGNMELSDFYDTRHLSPLFFHQIEDKDLCYQLVDISGNNKIKELNNYDKLLIITGGTFKQKACEIDNRYNEVEGVLYTNWFKLNCPPSTRREEKLKSYFVSLIYQMEDLRTKAKKIEERTIRLRQTFDYEKLDITVL